MRGGRSRPAVPKLHRIGVVRAVLGVMDTDGDLLSASALLLDLARMDGRVQGIRDDLRVGAGIVELCSSMGTAPAFRALLTPGP